MQKFAKAQVGESDEEEEVEKFDADGNSDAEANNESTDEVREIRAESMFDIDQNRENKCRQLWAKVRKNVLEPHLLQRLCEAEVVRENDEKLSKGMTSGVVLLLAGTYPMMSVKSSHAFWTDRCLMNSKPDLVKLLVST